MWRGALPAAPFCGGGGEGGGRGGRTESVASTSRATGVRDTRVRGMGWGPRREGPVDGWQEKLGGRSRVIQQRSRRDRQRGRARWMGWWERLEGTDADELVVHF